MIGFHSFQQQFTGFDMFPETLTTIRRLLAIAAVFAVRIGFAQEPLFTDVTATHLPPLPPECMAAAVGDADGDGDPDMALAIERQPNVLILNDGTGVFVNVSERLPRTIHDSEDTEFIDVDADGDMDLVFASEDSAQNELYLNDGEAGFSDASDRLPLEGRSNALATLDVNGDGAPDLLIGNYGAEGVMLNDGRGNFSDGTEAYWPVSGGDTQDIELADVDGDGDQDVLVANEGQNHLYLNEGGRLLDATAERLPQRDDESREYRAFDADGDGDLDLVVVNIQLLYEWPRQDYLLLNDGTGTFVEADADSLPDGSRDHFTVQVADLDTDGDEDILLPGSTFTGDSGDYRVLLNDGTGRFADVPAATILPPSVNDNGIGFDIRVADFNLDGRDDLFLCNRSHPRTDPIVGGRHVLLLQGSR